MPATDYAVFNSDGTGEVVVTEPLAAAWDVEVLDESPDGQIYTSGEAVVRWTYGTLPQRELTQVDYDAIVAKRQANGHVRFRTQNNLGQYVICDGMMDPRPPLTRRRGQVPGAVVEFRRVIVVG